MRLNRLLRCINPILVEHKRICQHCKNFDFMENTCRKFKEMDVITGKIVYVPAVKCRYDEKKCGLSAVNYDENVSDTTVNIKLNQTTSKIIFYTVVFYYMIIPVGYIVGVFTLLSICFPTR